MENKLLESSILSVDDDTDNVNLLAHYLKADYRLKIAAGGLVTVFVRSCQPPAGCDS